MVSINNSGKSSILQRLFQKSDNDLKSIYEKLSSGKRINHASDDAAGLAIASALEADSRVLSQAERNSGDAISIANIRESALDQLGDISARQAELATQSANGVLSDDQRVALDQEYQALSQEASRIIETAEFNGTNVLSSEGVSIQVGTDASSNSQITLEGVATDNIISTGNVLTQAAAQSAIDELSSVQQELSKVQGKTGAEVTRIQVSAENSQSRRIESDAARSRIEDADVASLVADKVKNQILQNAGVAVQAQANQTADIALKLLG